MAGQPLKRFSELLGESNVERLRNELKILDGLMANAISEKAWDAALKIFDKAHEILKRAPQVEAAVMQPPEKPDPLAASTEEPTA